MNTLDDHLLLNTLCQDLGEVEDQIKSLNDERDRLRAHISEIVERLGGKAHLRGFGTLQIASPTVVASYDRKGLDGLIKTLLANGHDDLAATIKEHRRESMRTGGLRITRDQPE